MTWIRGEPVLYLKGVAVRFLARWREDSMLPSSLARPLYDVYVQPAWMGGLHAQAIARGEETVDSARDIARDFDKEHAR